MTSDAVMMDQRGAAWRIGADRLLTLDQPRFIGILNATPDSFSDGGRYRSTEDAVQAALCLKEQGACIIDIGGESTRPGAEPVDSEEQIRRTVPVIRALRRQIHHDRFFISIDTTLARVAAAALDAGADIINDTSAGRDDQAMLPLAGSRGCGLILMHRRTLPLRDSYSDQYQVAPDYGGDVVGFVKRFLKDRREAAIAAGVNPQAIVIDPGLGFGKSVEQNFELIRRTSELLELEHPVLSAASRKSFIGAATGESTPDQRVAGSIAVSAAHFMCGVRLFRTHDVAAHRQALMVLHALHGGGPDSV